MPFSLSTIFLVAALAGGALLVIQIALSLIGSDSDVDGDLDVDVGDAGDIGGHLSFRTVVAFVTFFGIAGRAALAAGLSSMAALGIAIVVGSLAFWLVGLALLQISRLRSSGNVEVQNAIGVEARVYLAIPAARSGSGAVTVPIQGRTMQYKAVTRGAAIATGQFCKVVGVLAGDTLEVEAS
jgi:ABC-type transport system involved in cytochrome c biogenesis permease subunit